MGALLTTLLGSTGLTQIVSDLGSTVSQAIGRLIPDATTALQLKADEAKQSFETQKALYECMAQVMAADSHSDSRFTRWARPMVSYWSLLMITTIGVLGYLGHGTPVTSALAGVPPELWELLKYSIGIYAAGRSLEKVATTVATAIKGKR